MQNQQSYQLQMTENLQLTLQRSQQQFQTQKYRKEDCCTQEDIRWIQHFLSPSALITQSPIHIKLSQQAKEGNIIETLSECKQNSIDSAQPLKGRRSPFHNFQKHLITLLKKIAYIRRADVQNKRGGVRAYELWKNFKEGKDFSKKSLYLVFGVAQASNHSFIVQMAEESPQLQKMLKKHGLEEIQCAQTLLRKLVIEKVSKLSKQQIQLYCKMNKFEDFYQYLQYFMAQLQGEGVCKRLKKEQKSRVFQEAKELSR